MEWPDARWGEIGYDGWNGYKFNHQFAECFVKCALGDYCLDEAWPGDHAASMPQDDTWYPKLVCYTLDPTTRAEPAGLRTAAAALRSYPVLGEALVGACFVDDCRVEFVRFLDC